MSTINIDNLDELLFDYLEGNLGPAQEAELEAFLKAHPEHAAELEAWKATFVKPGPQVPVYAGAQSLVQSGAGGWMGGLNLLGWGSLVVAVVTVAVLLLLPAQPKQETPVLRAESESDRIEVVEKPEPLVTDAGTDLEDTLSFTIVGVNSEPFVPWIDSVYQPERLKMSSGQLSEEELFDKWLQSANYHLSGLEKSSPFDSLSLSALPDSLPLPPDRLAIADTAATADTSMALSPKTNDFSTQRSTPPGKKKRNKKARRAKKPVRVVPLKSDAF